ncbi:MAG: hypothetical protein NVS1B10_06840 [Candidatus Saccharimonadales bacterium]
MSFLSGLEQLLGVHHGGGQQQQQRGGGGSGGLQVMPANGRPLDTNIDPIQGDYTLPLDNQIQGGVYNPGATPLQPSRGFTHNPQQPMDQPIQGSYLDPYNHPGANLQQRGQPQGPHPLLQLLRLPELGATPQIGKDEFPQLNQGGQFNPGYTPLQSSGFGPGGNPQQGAYQDQPGQLNGRNFNPQQSVGLY